MPTDMKKSATKMFCSGWDSRATRWRRSDSLMTTPAKNAPSAKDTSKSWAET
ncbi:hypothetical protein D3C83_185520 [compost metagenome]